MTSHPSSLDRLRDLMDADPLTPADTAVAAIEQGDDGITSALESVGFDAFSTAAQDILLGIDGSAAAVDPDARGRFVAAAGRALRKRRDDSSPLPRLLFLARHSSGEDIAAVAEHLAVQADDLSEVERGRAALETLGADTVVAWIRRYRVPTDRARTALVEALQIQRAGDRAAAAAFGQADIESSEFFRDVVARLERAPEA